MKRTFKMSPKLLMDVITRQAGSIEKSILEMVQNAIDANSTQLKITITPTQIIAEDDGAGMNKDEILKYFEIFGESLKRYDEDKLGTFGMGRGQIFAQGKTVWTTNNHQMIVDVKENGLDYDLEEKEINQPGTKIEVNAYRKLTPFFITEKLKEWIKFVPIKVYVNDELFSQYKLDEEEGKVLETDDAFILLDTNNRGLRLYNMGIYVKTDMSYGVKATVITKKNIKVNFARNDIIEDCPIYNKIIKKLKHYMTNILAEPGAYHNVDNKRQIVRLISESDEAKKQLGHLNAFKTGNDQWVSYDEVKEKGSVSFCSTKDGRIADAYMQSSGGIVLIDKPDYKNIFQNNINIGNFKELTKDVIIKIKEYLPNREELRLADLAKEMMNAFGFDRKLKFASREDARAWTDGKSKIWLNKDLLKLPRKQFVFTVYESIVHEMSHDNDTERSDLHGEEYYQRYHDLVKGSIERLGGFVE